MPPLANTEEPISSTPCFTHKKNSRKSEGIVRQIGLKTPQQTKRVRKVLLMCPPSTVQGLMFQGFRVQGLRFGINSKSHNITFLGLRKINEFTRAHPNFLRPLSLSPPPAPQVLPTLSCFIACVCLYNGLHVQVMYSQALTPSFIDGGGQKGR